METNPYWHQRLEADRRLHFVVPGRPVAKARPRVTRRGGYTAQATREYEELVASCANDALDRAGLQPPLPGQFVVWLKFGYQGNGRPDIDNLAKSVLDGLQRGLQKDGHQLVPGPLADDSQVVELHAQMDLLGRDEYALVELYEVLEVKGD